MVLLKTMWRFRRAVEPVLNPPYSDLVRLAGTLQSALNEVTTRLQALERERATFLLERDQLLNSLHAIEARARARQSRERARDQVEPDQVKHNGNGRTFDQLDAAVLKRKGG